MDGQTRFLKVTELKRELHADGCTDERALAILAEVRKLEAKPRQPRKKRQSDLLRDMETPMVLGYELDRETLTPIRRYVN
jgi:hypothetical protein